MFVPRKNQNLAQAALTTLALSYHQTVYNLRQNDRNAILGLLMVIAQNLLMLLGFLLMFYLIRVRTSPVRGDFIIYLFSGIIMFMTHIKAVGAVSGSGALTSGMNNHAPLNSVILMAGAALAALYHQIIACFALLILYHVVFQPVHLENWRACLAMLILAWTSGCAVGLVFLAIKPWWPRGTKLLTLVYQRLNMVASGKMFVANLMPTALMPYFAWNPLFHLIDQTRGFAFINYSPHRTWVLYPVYFTLAVLMVGLMLEFTTRRKVSLSWSAGQ
ncbi:ABC transporter (plasmid) [Paracoccus sp. TK19116]|uniref:ABC transporter n=1 Tax=Paracoccus albicereus TaxID=2922394 RepID=A0ABT1MNV4_9RHOB|nr:ABC transporter [Paracoccus albicereus]MCQ0969246.1 ABC transporter [Paracoccus albicereus]